MEASTSGPRADRPARPPAMVAAIAVVGLGLLAGFWWWASADSRTAPADADAEGTGLLVSAFPGGLRMAPFVGDRACAECHPGEEARHARSGHSRTFRPALERALARQLVGTELTDPEDPEVTWTYAVRDGQFQVDRVDAGGSVSLIIDYAFGSGQHATTFVSLDVDDPAGPACLEHRLTYFAAEDQLGITPGQWADAPNPHNTPIGAVMPPEQTLKCFRCHTSATSAEGPLRLDPATMVPNVTCERCHGSGLAHVEAVRRGEASDPEIAFAPGRWTTEQQMLMCGFCHRHPDRFEPEAIRVDNPELVRHQPVGLMQSACYVESRGALSCVTCHDPHARTSTDEARYVATCLDCHRPAPEAPGPVPCPVSPSRGCLACHMPSRDTGQGIRLTDHWIRVVGPDEDLEAGPLARPASAGGPGHGDVE